MSADGSVSDLECPFCRERKIEVASRASYARGYLLAYQTGYKLFIGCTRCVASELRKEAGRSALYGWFSPKALIFNAIYVPWNLLKSTQMKPDRASVEKALGEIGVPDTQALQKIDDVIYALMAAMVNADGRVDDSELAAVAEIGPRLVQGFDMNRLEQLIANTGSQTPIETLVGSVAPFLSPTDKKSLLHAMLVIARADGEFDPAEEKVVHRARKSLGISKSEYSSIQGEL